MRPRAALAILLLLLLLLAAAPLFAEAPDFIPIAAARRLPAGTTVTVLGHVTVVPGTFAASSDFGFALQDQTGGIWVSLPRAIDLGVGRKVLVTGKLGASNGELRIVPEGETGVRTQGGGFLRVATGHVGEAVMGFIVTIEGTVVSRQDDGQYGFKLVLDDGSGPVQVFLSKTTNIDPAAKELALGQRLRVTGFATRYDDTFEVEPRSRRDLHPLR